MLEDRLSLAQAYLSQGELFYQMGKLTISRQKFLLAQSTISTVPHWHKFVRECGKVLQKTKAKVELNNMLGEM